MSRIGAWFRQRLSRASEADRVHMELYGIACRRVREFRFYVAVTDDPLPDEAMWILRGMYASAHVIDDQLQRRDSTSIATETLCNLCEIVDHKLPTLLSDYRATRQDFGVEYAERMLLAGLPIIFERLKRTRVEFESSASGGAVVPPGSSCAR